MTIFGAVVILILVMTAFFYLLAFINDNKDLEKRRKEYLSSQLPKPPPPSLPPPPPLISNEEYKRIEKNFTDNYMAWNIGLEIYSPYFPFLPSYDDIKYRPDIWKKIVECAKAGMEILPSNIYKDLGLPNPYLDEDEGIGDYPYNWEEIAIEIRERDGHRCKNCGTHYSALHVHHIVPLSRGGSNNPGNLITICEDCHKKIHPHMMDE